MLTPDHITAAVSGAVRELFPGEEVYANVAPRGFTRPSNMVELNGITLGEVSPGGVELRYTYRITDFVEVDERHNSHLAALDLRTMLLVSMFAKGYLKAGTRALKVRSCATAHNFDFTETTVTLSLSYSREELDPAAVLPMMEQLTLITKTKEDTGT
ncbi:DUF6838 family protein [Oscillibacter sp.]|uniref:DUF6838 family protein n=1 Tax=Oscillibacter sp. TaxID=1945593 RepID=UPI00289CA4BB|nr:hypothetical protein [Oscillibacter sp.]